MIDSLKQQFAFLEDEYGLEYRKVPANGWDRKWTPAVSFASPSTGVLVTYDARDQFLTARIYPLREGNFPMRQGRIDLSTGYPINSVAFLAGPEHPIGGWREENARFPGAELTLTQYMSRVAHLLRAFADDLLRGDFSRASEIEQATATIRRQATEGPA